MDTRSQPVAAPSAREAAKGQKLEYLYQSTDPSGLYALLGSLVRAVGKEGWRVGVVASAATYPTFVALQALLNTSDRLVIKPTSEATFFSAAPPFDLVLIDAMHETATVKSLRDSLIGQSHVMVAGNDPQSDDYDLITGFTQQQLHPQGVIAFTGTGKGKTSSALGLAAQAITQGQRVAIIQWFKERKSGKLTWAINEHEFPAQLRDPDLIEFYPTGMGFYGSPDLDRVQGEQAYQQHRAKAWEGVDLAYAKLASGEYAVIVLDELVDTVAEIAQNIEYPLIDLADVQQLLATAQNQSKTRVVVTGRRVSDHWAAYVRESHVLTELRHPWSSKGKGAVSGLDF